MWLRRKKERYSAIDTQLVADDVFLRPARIEDCDEWISVRRENRVYLKPFEPAWPENCLTEDFFIRRLERLNNDWLHDRTYAFLIFEKNSGELSGGININNITRGAGQQASLGYWISQKCQGRGWMTQSALTVLDFAFRRVRLARMNAATLPHNVKSRNMLLRLGFAEEGFAKRYIQINGVREDHILYGLNREDFYDSKRLDLSAP